MIIAETTASYSFPVLGGDRMDYRHEYIYETQDWDVNSGVVHLRHRIDGDNLVSRLIQSGEAHFGVAVVMKATMYRKTFVADSGGALSVEQNITIQKGNRSLESPKIFPMVIYQGEEKNFVADKAMGLDDLWCGRAFNLIKGAIIARDKEYEFQPGFSRLLRIKPDPEVPMGAIKVEIVAADSGYFVAKVSPDFFKDMRRARTISDDKAQHRKSILANALSAGFAAFAKQYNSDDPEFKTLENFQTIKRQLEAKDIPTWEDGDDFDACRAAWAYQPHDLHLDTVSEEDENE